jgi:acyl-CoA reductase-like NAD-dependent aldehyde dehydrogenase
VTKNVDIAATAPKIAGLAFANSGQVCLALKRIYIHESIFDEFRDAMVSAVKTMKFGDGTDATITHGPIQNSMQYERVKGFFNDIEKEGLNVAVGGKNEESMGYFIQPTIIDRPKDDSRIVVEEPFGMPFPPFPILSFLSYPFSFLLQYAQIREK